MSGFWKRDTLLPPNKDPSHYQKHEILTVEEDETLMWPDGVVHYALADEFSKSSLMPFYAQVKTPVDALSRIGD
jgi:hypothetical protein